jgi:hypothetical protein
MKSLALTLPLITSILMLVKINQKYLLTPLVRSRQINLSLLKYKARNKSKLLKLMTIPLIYLLIQILSLLFKCSNNNKSLSYQKKINYKSKSRQRSQFLRFWKIKSERRT